jgi:Protein of unknown function (DUF2948)
MMPESPLKLMARDAADLEVIAACVQDALVPIGEMAFLPAEQRFILVLNRFRWDRIDAGEVAQAERSTARSPTSGDAAFWEQGDAGPRYERVHSGLRFERVTAVRTRGIDLHNRDRILELLTIQAEPSAVSLFFAGGAAVRIEVAELRCYLEDFGEGWPTRWRPSHPGDGDAGGSP